MFSSVLIANRGEIACRIIRTARAMGMHTIAVYSEADADALHVRMADEAVAIGPAAAAESYLRADRIVEAARQTGADCIHPGYGFLAENAAFAEACAQAGIVFVGPPPTAIRAMGLKDEAKALMKAAGVPVVPGYHGDRQDEAFLKQKAYETGYPVLIKAVAGGGGKGMRRVDKAIAFEDALAAARREAASAFGDDRVLIEKYVESPRHVEMQVFADGAGNAVYLFERDCSLQRRHQKVIEEAPAPGMTEEVRRAMGEAAVAAAKAVGYQGAGTVEFIADGSDGLRVDRFWFMEMNTRLQVEHPVTEAITGIDLVELQFLVAAGRDLPFAQQDLSIDGHAVEARLYAEDPDNGFLPSTGRLHALDFAAGDGIRIDTGVEEGAEVSPFYDPMIAKVIAHGFDRNDALDRLSAALRATIVAGPRSNLGFLATLCDHAEFRAGSFDTGFIDRHGDSLLRPAQGRKAAIALGAMRLVEREAERVAREAALRSNEVASPWNATDGFQLGPARVVDMPVTADGEDVRIELSWTDDGLAASFFGEAPDWHDDIRAATVVDGRDGTYVLNGGRQIFVKPTDPAAHEDEVEAEGRVTAPMHGKLIATFVEPGQAVAKGDRLFIVEAMKMEHAVAAPGDAIVAEVLAAAGDQVDEGAVIVVFADTGESTAPDAGEAPETASA